MNFINNWMQPVTLAAGVTSIALDLADGRYRLSIADSGTAATRWEIVEAVLEGGEATLARGLEGTLDQGWPEGSVIYASITAGMLAELYQRISSLEARVTALEGGAGISVTVGQFSEAGQTLHGFYDDLNVGAVAPSVMDVPGIGSANVLVAAFAEYEGAGSFFVIALAGEIPQGTLQAVDLDGYQFLSTSATYGFDEPTNKSQWLWPVDVPALPWAAGEQRRVTLTFN